MKKILFTLLASLCVLGAVAEDAINQDLSKNQEQFELYACPCRRLIPDNPLEG